MLAKIKSIKTNTTIGRKRCIIALLVWGFFGASYVLGNEDNDSIQRYIDDIIRFEVKAGLHSEKEINHIVVEAIKDNGFEKDFSKTWVKQRVRGMLDALASESKTWRKPTDVIRLREAFAELNKIGILSLHNVGYTIEDGIYAINKQINNTKKQKSKHFDGYCFYTEQDVHSAIDTNSFYLAFGSKKHTTISAKLIGEKIVNLLQKHHINTIWDHTPTHRIKLVDFHWHTLYSKRLLWR